MADKKISELNSASLPLSGTEVVPIVQGGETKKVAVSEFKDVLEFANLVLFPATGESSKIYVALDTNLQYRWSGSAYVQIGGVEIGNEIFLNVTEDLTKTIVWIGDSIISGVGPSVLANRYSTLTSNALGYIEDNRAISGSSVKTAPFSLIPTKTDSLEYLVIGYGTNDKFLGGNTPALFNIDLSNFVDNAISKGWSGSQIILVSMPGYQFQSGATNTLNVNYNTQIQNVATAKGCFFVDMYSKMITNELFGAVTNFFLTTDGTHPNDLGSLAQMKIILPFFEYNYNLTGQTLVINGDSNLKNLKLANFNHSSSGFLMGTDKDGNLFPLIGLPDKTIAIGDFFINQKLIQSGAVVPTASGSNDVVLFQGSKIVSAFSNTNYGEIDIFNSNGKMEFRNRLFNSNATIDFYNSQSAGNQQLALSILGITGVLRSFFGISLPFSDSVFIDQSFNATLYGRLNLYDASGNTSLRNSLSTGVFRQFMSNGVNGTQVQMIEVKPSGRIIYQNGGTFTDIPSARVAVNSTTEGFLPPRMTNVQRLAIVSPAIGLMVYCTDTVEGLYIYKSTGWTFII